MFNSNYPWFCRKIHQSETYFNQLLFSSIMNNTTESISLPSKSFPLYYTMYFYNVCWGRNLLLLIIGSHFSFYKELLVFPPSIFYKSNSSTPKSHSWIRLMNNTYSHSSWSPLASSWCLTIYYLLFQQVSSTKHAWVLPSRFLCIQQPTVIMCR